MLSELLRGENVMMLHCGTKWPTDDDDARGLRDPFMKPKPSSFRDPLMKPTPGGPSPRDRDPDINRTFHIN